MAPRLAGFYATVAELFMFLKHESQFEQAYWVIFTVPIMHYYASECTNRKP